MLFSKIKKHLLLFYIQFNESKTLKSMLFHKDPTLDIIVDCFKKLKSNKFEAREIEVFRQRKKYRDSLLKDTRRISFEIFGTNNPILVKDICKKASSPSIWGKLFYLITSKFQNINILEIGTNLGISGGFFLEAIKDKQNSFFVTMEGVDELCSIAQNEFLKIINVEKFNIYQGLYENTFPKLLQTHYEFDMVFIDGNHKKQSTLEYFNALKIKLKHPSIIIFDDINWSCEMSEAWEIIKTDEIVAYSIDFYKLGIVIINSEKPSSPLHYHLHLSY